MNIFEQKFFLFFLESFVYKLNYAIKKGNIPSVADFSTQLQSGSVNRLVKYPDGEEFKVCPQF